MNNMVQSCGREWVNRRVAGGWFQHNGQLLCMTRVTADGLCCDDVNGKRIFLPEAVLTGFSVFVYPRLGYRRDPATGNAVFLRRRNSYDRGLRPHRIKVSCSPAVTAIGRANGMEDMHIITAAFNVPADTVADVKEVLAGRRLSAIMNEDVLVEPGVEDADVYTVYYRTRSAGHISPEGVITWRSQAYADLLSHLFVGI